MCVIRIAWKFQINVHTPIAAMHHVMNPMLERGRGMIVNICSTASFTPRPFFCHYTATKGALSNFSEALRMELAGAGVHVLTVYPGPVDTPMAHRNWKQFEDAEALRKKAPTGNTATLARLILRAMEKKSARIIYPGIYKINWWFRSLSFYLADRTTPAVSGKKTPKIGDDAAV